jgi:ABC-type multidrug transport system fused ATPase/permease subunit
MDGPAAIRFDHVGVYGEVSKSLLSDICLDIAPGQFIAVVGPTGGGKTTLIDCVLDLTTPGRGEVLIDAIPMREISRVKWRRAIGYLGQDPIIFSGTIRDNVAWGRDGVDDEAIAAALKSANADFVLGLAEGLDTVVGDRGGILSGGERQRIALARALVGHPRLLVLDEATSALDVETERQITNAIYARRGQVTIIAITHRIAAVRDADVIVMLETGRIVERGSFDSLLAANGRFATFWRSQFKEEKDGVAVR